MEETLEQILLSRTLDLITREELAKKLEVPVFLLDAWVKGEVTIPEGKIVMLADALNRYVDE